MGVNDGINQIHTGKVVPFNSRRNLKKDPKSRLSHFHSTHTQAHSESANKGEEKKKKKGKQIK